MHTIMLTPFFSADPSSKTFCLNKKTIGIVMEDGGYSFELCGQDIPDITCPICLLIMCQAMELPCSHSACKKCLEKWEKEQNG